MNARELTAALRGQWRGSSGSARCPAHDDHSPSLSISEADDRLLVHCHAGCDQAAVWGALEGLGLVNGSGCSASNGRPRRHRASHPDDPPAELQTAAHQDRARRIWEESQPPTGTLVETYLRSRGITLPPPNSIRFNPALKHKPTGLMFPAMVAGVARSDGKLTAIHRVFLLPGGDGKAQVSEPKMCLGLVKGGAVRLTPPAESLHLCESIEDGLALLQMTGRATWAAPSAGFMASFDPPEGVEEVVLAPDNDEAGHKAIATAALRLRDKGLRVRMMLPPAVSDWCDVLEIFEERAGIRQFDGDTDRHEAERLAFEEIITDGR